MCSIVSSEWPNLARETPLTRGRDHPLVISSALSLVSAKASVRLLDPQAQSNWRRPSCLKRVQFANHAGGTVLSVDEFARRFGTAETLIRWIDAIHTPGSCSESGSSLLRQHTAALRLPSPARELRPLAL